VLFGIIFYYIFYIEKDDSVKILSRSIYSSFCTEHSCLARQEAIEMAAIWGYVIPVYKEVLNYFPKET